MRAQAEVADAIEKIRRLMDGNRDASYYKERMRNLAMDIQDAVEELIRTEGEVVMVDQDSVNFEQLHEEISNYVQAVASSMSRGVGKIECTFKKDGLHIKRARLKVAGSAAVSQSSSFKLCALCGCLTSVRPEGSLDLHFAPSKVPLAERLTRRRL
jgi:hypothetical protein